MLRWMIYFSKHLIKIEFDHLWFNLFIFCFFFCSNSNSFVCFLYTSAHSFGINVESTEICLCFYSITLKKWYSVEMMFILWLIAFLCLKFSSVQICFFKNVKIVFWIDFKLWKWVNKLRFVSSSNENERKISLDWFLFLL